MRRRPLLRLLEAYLLRYPEESEVTDRFVSFVNDHEDCFERHLAVGHITGSAWIVSEDGGETLLTHHAKLDIWVQPGGHADGDPDVLAVAMREAEEETGLLSLTPEREEIFDLDVHRIPARKNEPGHDHFDVRFLLRQSGDRSYRVSEESHDLAWVPLGEIERFSREESILRMRDKTAGFLRR